MPNTKAVGNTSEAAVLAEFVRLGFPVCLPFGDNQCYDLVVEAGGRFLSVQCKTAWLCGRKGDNACIRFNAHSGGFGPADSSSNRSRPYRGEVDLFAVYSPDTRKVYVLPVDECPITEVWLRLIPARNNQQRKVRMAEEHTLAAWAASLGYAESASASSPPAVLAATGRS